MTTRPEAPGDERAVRALLLDAFETSDEADLVDDLRAHARPYVALVAERDARVVGHIAFTEVTLDPAGDSPALGLGLAPLAVLSSAQGRGIGSELVHAGLAACRAAGATYVVVLGDPAYYGRFGFVPASTTGLRCAFDAPADAFQVLVLREGAPSGGEALVRFRPEFDRFV